MVYIIVEGQTDKELVKNILAPKLEKTDFEFLGLKGIDSVKKTIENLEELGLSQNSYFAIVDADSSFDARNREMEALTKTNQVPFYIFPNHQDDGDLETLLLSHIDEENKVIKCFDTYAACVGKYIDNKAKLYAYTTLEYNKRPEQYIQDLTLGNNFDDLKQKLKNLFKEEN
ncbi:hypothetical protein MNB_SV-3-1335 [hydrothermal vent metagenome]|uniref:Uncharacterized protein n=1 Tax=hydrothermal vent metagenome TaxID=652676 RepID=A0A1W1CPY0_9ZZZZ